MHRKNVLSRALAKGQSSICVRVCVRAMCVCECGVCLQRSSEKDEFDPCNLLNAKILKKCLTAKQYLITIICVIIIFLMSFYQPIVIYYNYMKVK